MTLASLPSLLHAAPFAGSNADTGKKLFTEKNCGACHVSMFGGDGSKMFTRPERKVKTPEQLISQIRACNANLGANLFPEDEAHIAAYLNREFYKFK
ncbi:MAG: cytochrome c [Burkholderiales bacterium]|nr:cytochrome c [Burkholderiales bacterium]